MRLIGSDFIRIAEENMSDIGEPIEIIDVEPLSLPAPLPRTKNEREGHLRCS